MPNNFSCIAENSLKFEKITVSLPSNKDTWRNQLDLLPTDQEINKSVRYTDF